MLMLNPRANCREMENAVFQALQIRSKETRKEHWKGIFIWGVRGKMEGNKDDQQVVLPKIFQSGGCNII